MQKIRITLSLSLLVLTLGLSAILVHPLQAQEGDLSIENGEVIEEELSVEEDILIAVQSIIQSLEAQNAPVPYELAELLKLGRAAQSTEEIRMFEEASERYFGPAWKEQILQDAAVLSAKEKSLLVRSRIYLSSLIANADHIALQSPLDAQEIRASATRQIAELRETDGGKEDFFVSFGVMYGEIFPEGSTDDLTGFRDEVTHLLAELSDAIMILIDGRKQIALEADLANLQSRLQLVDDTQKLTAWLARFDAFARKLLTHAVPAEFPVLIGDIRTLLHNLTEYLDTLRENDIDTGTYPERVAELRDALNFVSTDNELNAFFGKLEEVITGVAETYATSPKSEK